MGNWIETNLESVCSRIYSGGTPSTKHPEYWDGDLPWLSSGETGQRFIFETIRRISQIGVEKSATKLARKGSTVVATAGQGYTRGQASYLMIDTYVNQSVLVLEPNTTVINPLYLYYNLDRRYEEFRQLSDGTSTRGGLSGWIVKKMPILLPPLDIQEKIVSILYGLDQKILTNTTINKKLDYQAQLIFRSWFVESVEKDEWDRGHFVDLIQSTLGGDWGKDSADGNYSEMVYCIRGADIPEVRAGNKGKMPTRYILPKNYESKQLVAGDIVVEISGGSPTQSTGRAAAITQSLLDRYDKGMVCTNFCRAIKPKPGFSMFVFYYWQYFYDNGIFFLYENGTTGIKNLDLNGFIDSEEIIIPPVSLCQKFDDYCNSTFAMIFENGSENEQLAKLRDSLSDRLLTNDIDLINIP